jgi:NADH-quinone oxidoreductase subunit L
VPLILLGAASLVGGLLYLSHWITDWLEPVTGHAEHHEPLIPEHLMLPIVLAVVAIGVALAVRQYRDPIAGETPADSSVSWLTRAGRHELYGNAINDKLAVRPTRHTVRTLVYVDGAGLDAIVTGFADRLGDLANLLRKQQNGLVRSYALSMVTGALVILATLLAVTLS